MPLWRTRGSGKLQLSPRFSLIERFRHPSLLSLNSSQQPSIRPTVEPLYDAASGLPPPPQGAVEASNTGTDPASGVHGSYMDVVPQQPSVEDSYLDVKDEDEYDDVQRTDDVYSLARREDPPATKQADSARVEEAQPAKIGSPRNLYDAAVTQPRQSSRPFLPPPVSEGPRGRAPMPLPQ